MRPFILALLLAFNCHGQFEFTDLPLMAFGSGVLNGSGAATPDLSTNEMWVWYKASDKSALTLGTAVTNWTDKTGHSRTATNTSALAGTIETNYFYSNHFSIHFTNQFLIIPDGPSGQTGEIFAVIRAYQDPGASGKNALWNMAKTGYSGDTAHPFTDSTFREHFGSIASLTIPALPWSQSASNWHTWNVQTTPEAMQIRYNGDLIAGLDGIAAGFSNTLYIAKSGAQNAVVDIAEIIIYTNVVSATIRSNVHYYFSTNYGIAVTNTTLSFGPSNMMANMEGWWRAEDLTLLSNGDPVTNWTDISGNSRNWTNNTATKRPVFTTSVFGTYPSLRFDGSTSLRRMYLNSADISLGTNWTVICVGKHSNDSSIISHKTVNIQLRVNLSSGNANRVFNAGNFRDSATWPHPLLQVRMDVWQRDSTTGFPIFWQNATNSTVAATITQPMAINKLGNDLDSDESIPLKGDVAELILWNRLLRSDEIVKLYFSYFKPKYGLP